MGVQTVDALRRLPSNMKKGRKVRLLKYATHLAPTLAAGRRLTLATLVNGSRKTILSRIFFCLRVSKGSANDQRYFNGSARDWLDRDCLIENRLLFTVSA